MDYRDNPHLREGTAESPTLRRVTLPCRSESLCMPPAQLERWSWSEPVGWNDETRAVVRRFQNLQQMLFITQRGWGDYFKRQISLYRDQQRISVLEAARLDREGALKAVEGILRAGLQ
jgi:hypothetical protein